MLYGKITHVDSKENMIALECECEKLIVTSSDSIKVFIDRAQGEDSSSSAKLLNLNFNEFKKLLEDDKKGDLEYICAIGID